MFNKTVVGFNRYYKVVESINLNLFQRIIFWIKKQVHIEERKIMELTPFYLIICPFCKEPFIDYPQGESEWFMCPLCEERIYKK